MVGLISWVINANRDGEIIEPVQIDSVPTTPAPTTADPISELPPRSSPPTTHHPLPRYLRKQINNDDLIASIDQVGQKLVDCLSIAESALTTLVQRRPPSNSMGDIPPGTTRWYILYALRPSHNLARSLWLDRSPRSSMLTETERSSSRCRSILC